MTDAARLRILHVFRAPLGGLFRHVLDLARGQAERGHEVGIFCDASTGGTRADAVFAELSGRLSLGITRVPMSRYPSLTDARAQFSAIALRRELAPDVVHCHGSKGGVYGRMPALISPGGATSPPIRLMAAASTTSPGVPSIRSTWRSSGCSNAPQTFPVREPLHRRALRGLYRPRTQDGPPHRPQRRVRPEFEPIDHSEAAFDLVYLGELRSAKGIDTLIEALGLLKTRDG